jgi:hypothetical protein
VEVGLALWALSYFLPEEQNHPVMVTLDHYILCHHILVRRSRFEEPHKALDLGDLDRLEGQVLGQVADHSLEAELVLVLVFGLGNFEAVEAVKVLGGGNFCFFDYQPMVVHSLQQVVSGYWQRSVHNPQLAVSDYLLKFVRNLQVVADYQPRVVHNLQNQVEEDVQNHLSVPLSQRISRLGSPCYLPFWVYFEVVRQLPYLPSS